MGFDDDGVFERVLQDAREVAGFRFINGTAADAGAAAQDGFVDIWCAVNFVVQHDGEAVADKFRGELAEEFRAVVVKAQADFPAFLAKVRIGVGDHRAGDVGLAFDEESLLRGCDIPQLILGFVFEHFDLVRWVHDLRVAVDAEHHALAVGVDDFELQLRDFFELLRVPLNRLLVDAGELNEDAPTFVCACGCDDGLAHAVGVHALAERLDCPLHHPLRDDFYRAVFVLRRL